MGLKQVKVFTTDLTLGMYVSRLDKPWTQTPFPLQGFFIKSANDIKELNFHCKYVYIDTEKGREPINVDRKRADAAAPSMKGAVKEAVSITNQSIDVKRIPVVHDEYAEVTPLKKEVIQARQMHKHVTDAVEKVYEQVSAGGSPNLAGTQKAATEMVDSVLRNPDAFTWLSRIRDRDEHTWGHSVRSSVWAVLFGRHIGLKREELQILATGVLLKDVGKIKIPASVLTVGKRNPAQEKLYRTFVDHSVNILRSIPELDRRVIKVVASHCERLDGSGFPNKLVGDKIPLLAKIAGLVTVYDEISNPRGTRQTLSPSKAIGWLYKVRNRLFQEQLVVEFIQAIGVYPTGTVVELSTGDVGVVVEQNFARRLRPVVAIVRNALGETLEKMKILDMSSDAELKLSKGESPITIKADIEPGTIDIDIAAIRDGYINTGGFSLKKLFGFGA
ncbi:HD-GYP domain-containing protein [Umboniibacter marinipuniceus]|uniref:HD-GYP domain-containing protein (C-di-GMP phosphodiesterase class II) n=1 Tax=Umboniibacter marinipuniceus TaxID=569599 RepID=A0A3M0ADQ1_9GAMM|nr:HD-GYP domain-containing protein [Umboniibacter marinipuniceus]RMA82254.1 HD-GYP domain-containing protein (c-di-GMP phosphodiesterase class II) [Umboniibacter marinipuniceus]